MNIDWKIFPQFLSSECHLTNLLIREKQFHYLLVHSENSTIYMRHITRSMIRVYALNSIV